MQEVAKENTEEMSRKWIVTRCWQLHARQAVMPAQRSLHLCLQCFCEEKVIAGPDLHAGGVILHLNGQSPEPCQQHAVKMKVSIASPTAAHPRPARLRASPMCHCAPPAKL